MVVGVFPVETWSEIFDYLKTSDLYQCLQLSRALKGEAEKILYSRLSLSTETPGRRQQITKLLARYNVDPSLVRFVKVVDIELSEEAFWTTFLRPLFILLVASTFATRLAHFSFEAVAELPTLGVQILAHIVTTFLPAFPFRTLSIISKEPLNALDLLLNSLSAQTNLRRLRIGGLDGVSDSLQYNFAQHGSLRRLEYLELNDILGGANSYENLRRIVMAQSPIQALKITNCRMDNELEYDQSLVSPSVFGILLASSATRVTHLKLSDTDKHVIGVHGGGRIENAVDAELLYDTGILDNLSSLPSLEVLSIDISPSSRRVQEDVMEKLAEVFSVLPSPHLARFEFTSSWIDDIRSGAALRRSRGRIPRTGLVPSPFPMFELQ